MGMTCPGRVITGALIPEVAGSSRVAEATGYTSGTPPPSASLCSRKYPGRDESDYGSASTLEGRVAESHETVYAVV